MSPALSIGARVNAPNAILGKREIGKSDDDGGRQRTVPSSANILLFAK
jgi:hypothetical protein